MMRKKFMALVLAAIAATGIMASAQQQAQQNKMYTPRTFTDFAFEGVLLDIPQQQRIDSLHQALRTPRHQKVQAIGTCPDSARQCPQAQSQRRNHGKHHGKAPRGGSFGGGVMPGVEYVAKVKEILTPEQFDTFMSNIQTMPDNAVNNLVPAAPQKRDRAARAPQNCAPGNCNQQNCAPGNCTDQNCAPGNCNQENCAPGNCTKAYSKDGKHLKSKKDGKSQKDGKAKKSDKAKKQDKKK